MYQLTIKRLKRMDLFNKHEGMLNSAIEALHARTFFAGFPEMPAPAVYGETADADGQKTIQGAQRK